MAWAGDTVHWGTACVANLPANEQPRASLAFVFRRREASCDARGAPLTLEGEVLEDLDVVYARHIEPMVKHIRAAHAQVAAWCRAQPSPARCLAQCREER